MNDRLKVLLDATMKGEGRVPTRTTEYDRMDLFLTRMQRESKRICEYIMNQEPLLRPEMCFTGFFIFDGTVPGDAFTRAGHYGCGYLSEFFYLRPVDNLSTNEAQHAIANYDKVLKGGIRGMIAEIDESLSKHTDPEKIDFLHALRRVAETLVSWAHKCADRCDEFVKTLDNPDYIANVERLARTLRRVPENPPENFYEAILTIYICFSADPDSLGTLDRYLAPFYDKDISTGKITRDEAKEYLQELYLMVQAFTPRDSRNFFKGGQSHFCVGGYLSNGEDGFTETTRLVIDALMELPTYIPQVTFRWTSKTPHEVLRYVMDAERHDPNKRIAFTNDDKRIKCFTQICHIPFERAITYTMVGCNEPAFVGAITGSNSKINILRCVETLFHKKAEEIESCTTFDEFYSVFEREMCSDLERGYDLDNKYNSLRALDVNYIGSLFFSDCVPNGKSLTQGGGNTVIVSPMLLGITNVIDSLIIVKQFVFDEKRVTMRELIDAVKSNWAGYDDLHVEIEKRGDFFGNDTERSNAVGRRLYDSFYRFVKDKTNLFGYHFLIGDILGYNEHHRWFGENTKATPDGRYDGEHLKFCIGQSEGKDRNGLTALLNSVAGLDPNAIGCGATAFNVSLDEKLIRDDANFEKTVNMFETYFRNGGVHFQLNYVSREELLRAKADPKKYKSLRVRVTGFSDYFVNLCESIQDDIIRRTEIDR